jgi:hypothetical protein
MGGLGNTKMDGWDEYWLDIHSAGCKEKVRAWQTQRIADAAEKGCDGMDPDNVDAVSHSRGSEMHVADADSIITASPTGTIRPTL